MPANRSSMVLWLTTLAMGQAAPPSPLPVRTGGEGTPGVNVFAPGRWGIVGVKIANPGDRPVDLLSSHYFGDSANLQFARRIWVPPGARRETWYPLLPLESRTRSQTMTVRSLLIDRERGGETLLGEEGGTRVRDGLLSAHADTGPVTGLIADPDDPDGALLSQIIRVASNLSPRVARIDPDTLPPASNALHTLDQLIIGSDRLAGAPGAALAVRQWLHAGGRLWVRLDRVSPETVSLLLGHDLAATVVDRVGLTSWRIDRERATADPDDEAYDAAEPLPPGQPGGRSPWTVDSFEAPTEMVRLLAPGVRPLHTVNGWPASFWMRSGRGLVLFTTLAPRGWVLPRARGDPAAHSQNLAGRFKESDALRQLATPFLKVRDPAPAVAVSFDPLLASQVGHRVVSRGVVAVTLGLFCLGLPAGGWWLHRRQALAHLGWAGPAAGLLAAGVLVVIGGWSRGRAPPTLAAAQFVEIVPGTNEAVVSGRLAFLAPDGASATLGAESGGMFLPDGAAGTRRLVLADMDRWRWENLALSPGLHTAPFETTARLDEPVSARVTFGPDGATGTITPGPFRNLEDVILAMPSRAHLSVKPAAGGDFRIGPGDRLPAGQYLSSGVLTGDQQQRRIVFQQLLEQRSWPRYPGRPTILAWASPLELGFTFVEGARRTGSALVGIPLEADRPPAGTKVTIPAPFLPFRTVITPNLIVLYNARQGEWAAPRAAPGRTLLRFQVPPELLPLRVEGATLEIDLNARGRTVEVFAGTGNELLATQAGTNGTVRINLARANLLQPDPNGGLRLGLAVGAGTDDWKITDLRLELTGTVPRE